MGLIKKIEFKNKITRFQARVSTLCKVPSLHAASLGSIAETPYSPHAH